MLGIGVINGNGRLKDGHPFDGAEIIYVVHGGPGAIAGLTGRRSRTEMLIIAGIMVASIFCPPVILVAGVLGSRMAEFDDFIVAVDGIRVHDVVELGEALNQAKSGEIVYLTTIRNGQRKQLQLELPRPRAGSSASPPTSEYLR